MNESWIRTRAEEVIPRALVIDGSLHANDGIAQHHEVRATIESFDSVGIDRISRLTMGAQRGCEMAPGRETEDTKLARINAVVGGVSPYVAHGAHAVIDFHWILVRRHAVIKHECSYALRIEPLSYLNSFIANGYSLVASARDDENRRIGRFLCRDERIESRLVGFRRPERTGSTVRPQCDGLRYGGWCRL